MATGGNVIEVGASEVAAWMRNGDAVLIDVREPDEHARERIEGARLVALSRFDATRAAAAVGAGQRIVFHCKGGKRSAEACRLASSLVNAGMPVFSLRGGIEGWKEAGLAVRSGGGGPRVSVMRQVQMVIGAAVLAGAVLSWMVHPGFAALPAFFGAGLLFAGATGTCGLAVVLGRMPWNRSGGGAAGIVGDACGTPRDR